MKHRFVKITLIVVSGLILGVASAAVVLLLRYESGWSRYGPWRTNINIGQSSTDMYTRALVAVGGVLALPASEVVYLLAERDDSGRRLRATCTYRVSSGRLPARWWSLTVYGSDRYLIPNSSDRYSITSGEISNPDDWAVTVATRGSGGTWLPVSKRDDELILVLRLYHPAENWASALASDIALGITRETCV